MYRYGDSTPFPHQNDFLTALVGAIDCCVGLYRLEVAFAARENELREAQNTAIQQIKQLDALAQTAANAMTTTATETSVLAGVRAQILASVTTIIDNARRNANAINIDRGSPSDHHELRTAAIRLLEEFLCRCELPDAAWRWRWHHVNNKAAAELVLESETLTAVFSAPLSEDETWENPFALETLASACTMTVPQRRRNAKQPQRVKPEDLSRYRVIAIDARSGHRKLLLDHPRGKSKLILALQDQEAQDTPYVQRDDGPRFGLSEVDIHTVKNLWAAVDRAGQGLLRLRTRITSFRVGDKDLVDTLGPGEAATAVLQQFAPTLREVVRRSPTSRELILKRDLGDGRREELFVSTDDVCERFAGLPSTFHHHFVAAGLRLPSTSEAVEENTMPRSRLPGVTPGLNSVLDDLDHHTEEVSGVIEVTEVTHTSKTAITHTSKTSAA